MSYPIAGPIAEVIETHWSPGLDPFNPSSSSYVNRRISRQRYRQTMPYNMALPYTFSDQQVLKFPSNGTSHRFPEYDALNSTGVSGIRSELTDPELAEYAKAKARARFSDKLGKSADWGTGLAERKQAMSMMTRRLTSLVGFVRKLKRFDYYGAIRELTLNNDSLPPEVRRFKYAQGKARVTALIKQRRLRSQAKYFADNYLEFHFGWSPAASDIYSTIDFLQQDIEPFRIRASAVSKTDQRLVPGNTHYIGFEKVKIGAIGKIDNPNLWAANRLGIVNPAAIAFELIPFSFILDWFVNCSEFLGQFSEFWGASFSDAFWTHSHRETREWEAVGPDYGSGTPSYYVSGSNACFSVSRYRGFPPGPDLQIRAPWQLSARRGAAAASLLVQLMR